MATNGSLVTLTMQEIVDGIIATSQQATRESQICPLNTVFSALHNMPRVERVQVWDNAQVISTSIIQEACGAQRLNHRAGSGML